MTSPLGFVIDSTGIAIGEVLPPAPPVPPLVPEAGPVELEEDSARITVRGSGFRWAFDRSTGAVIEAEAGGVPVLTGGPVLMLLPQTSGACTTDFRLDIEPFNDICKDWRAESVSAVKDKGVVTVTVKGSYAEAAGWYAVKIIGRGRAELGYEFRVKAKSDPRQYGLVVYLPRPFDTFSWSRRGQWTAYPENHIGRPVGTAKALSPGRTPVFRKPPAWDWKDDQNALGSNDFRSTKANILWAILSAPSGEGLMLASDGRQAARAFLDGDRVGWLIADFSTGGGDTFFAPHHKMDDRPLAAGDTISGKISLAFVTSSR